MSSLPAAQPSAAADFISRWRGVQASELSTAQSFVRELCGLLQVEVPHPNEQRSYMFERPVTFVHGNGSVSAGRIDCYRQGAFVLEAKKLAKVAGRGFDDAMLRARAQAEGYARALPATEGRPPFLLVVDVGNVIEVYAEFTRSGATYTPFPDPASHRIALADLALPQVQALLRTIWLEPLALDPTRASARVTREVAARLAEVAKALEGAGHAPEAVAAFLTRCLFTMFAEDVGLLPRSANDQGAFSDLLTRFRHDPAVLGRMLHALWQDMDRGGFSAVLTQDVLRFNGKLFKQPDVLPLQKEQIDLLIEAAAANWTEVEPAIFGTLLERALDPAERHALGAHYTPRAYVERLVLPSVIEPLRADWADAQTAAILLANEAGELDGKKRVAKLEAARAEVRRFHHALTQVRVLDPACGSGNFLYVTLEHMKRLEGEVLDLLASLGETQQSLDADGLTVDPHQFLGIELNPRAAAIAELVLWIGYLQWHFRTRGNAQPPQPVLKDFKNIECRDAVLAYDHAELAQDADGKPVTRWNGIGFKLHPVTGEQVPDDAAQVAQWTYVNPHRADWPQADFIIGNPPFIGKSRMREALGDGYVAALRRVWQEVPDSADFVMYWWQHAAEQVRVGHARRFGLITTNSLRQTFNRRVVEQQLTAKPPLSLLFAIPDHPWVDGGDGAAVRIAMTVGVAGMQQGRLQHVTEEEYVVGDDAAHIEFDETAGSVYADLEVGANVASALGLKANIGMTSMGVMLAGSGFIIEPATAQELGLGRLGGAERHIRGYRNGKDLTAVPRGVMVIDLYGLSAETVRRDYAEIYQWLLERVKPERDANRDAGFRENWWLFGRPRPALRDLLASLQRYIATTETAKYRIFQFLDTSVLPDHSVIAVGSDDGFHLGILSSGVHIAWALAAGSRLGVGNDPRYNKTRCFETFPFPSDDTGLRPDLQTRIADLAEQLDAHRKRQQAAHPGLTLTGIYNVLEQLRRGAALNAKEKIIHQQGLVSVLQTLHDELDAAVLAAYGWSDLTELFGSDAKAASATLLQRLVTLNAARAAEEADGVIRWLRPALQNPAAAAAPQQQADMALDGGALAAATPLATQAAPWPKALPDQVRAVAAALAASPHGLSVAALARQFKGSGKWKQGLPPILETLAALGRARQLGANWHQA
jgi:hypothetical protein